MRLLSLVFFLTSTLIASAQTAVLKEYNDLQITGLTTNATNTQLTGYSVEDEKAGDFEMILWGVNPSTKGVIRFHLRVSFAKTGGVLTMSSVETVRVSFTSGTGISTATATLVSSNTGIAPRVNGIAATSIRWYGIVKLRILGRYID